MWLWASGGEPKVGCLTFRQKVTFPPQLNNVDTRPRNRTIFPLIDELVGRGVAEFGTLGAAFEGAYVVHIFRRTRDYPHRDRTGGGSATAGLPAIERTGGDGCGGVWRSRREEEDRRRRRLWFRRLILR